MPIALSDIYPEFTQMLIQTYFFRVYQMYIPDDWGALAQEIQSTKDAEIYPTLGTVPKTHKFAGERQFAGLGKKETFQVWNELYDAGFYFPLTVFSDDQYGIITSRLADLAMEAKRYPTELVYNVLNNGGSATIDATNDNLGYDGQPLFSQSHAGKASNDTQSNDNDAVVTITIDHLNTAVTDMKRFYDDKGRYLGIEPDTLVVPPELYMTARQLLNSGWLMSVGPGSSGGASAITNLPTANVFDVNAGGPLKYLISNPYITSATSWYVACSYGRMTKPIILQQREAPTLTVKLDPNTSDKVMDTNNGFATYKARWGAAPGDWHTIYRGST